MTFILIVISMLLTACAHQPITQFDDPRIKRELIAASDYVAISSVKQSERYACGVSCLESVLNYWNISVDQTTLLKYFPPLDKKAGYTIGELKDIVREHDAQAYAFPANLEFLKSQIAQGRPLIVPLLLDVEENRNEFSRHFISLFDVANLSRHFKPHKRRGHYVIVCGFYFNDAENETQYIWLSDPAKGLRLIPIERFEEMWQLKGNTCVVIFLPE